MVGGLRASVQVRTGSVLPGSELLGTGTVPVGFILGTQRDGHYLPGWLND